MNWSRVSTRDRPRTGRSRSPEHRLRPRFIDLLLTGIMRNRVPLAALLGVFLCATPALAQKTITGKVTTEAGTPLAGASVVVRGTRFGTTTNSQGAYSIRADVGQVLQYRYIGTAPQERTVGADNVIDVTLNRVATSLDQVVVTALGQEAQVRTLGAAQQTVQGTA